jgi:hypothetical protein
MADAHFPVPRDGQEQLTRLEEALFEIRRVIPGQEAMLERMLVCLLAGGHLVIEGDPGLARPSRSSRPPRCWAGHSLSSARRGGHGRPHPRPGARGGLAATDRSRTGRSRGRINGFLPAADRACSPVRPGRARSGWPQTDAGLSHETVSIGTFVAGHNVICVCAGPGVVL